MSALSPARREQAALLAATTHRLLGLRKRMAEGSVLKPLPPPTREQLHSEIISLDREIACLQRARQALCRHLTLLPDAAQLP